MKEPSPMPDAVIDSVFRAHTIPTRCPHCGEALIVDATPAHRILRSIWWDGLNGCYFFKLGTMLVGVELDGYMHT